MQKTATLLFLLTLTLTQCPNDEFCLNCEDSECEVCIYSYLDITNNQCVATDKVPNCTSYSDANTCLNCAPRYYLDNNECLPIEIKDCIIAHKVTDNVAGQNINTIVCLACADKMLITEGDCIPDNVCQLENCKTCARNYEKKEVCIRCEDEYVLNPISGKCVTQTTENCLALDENDTNLCGECVPGSYSAENKTCLITEAYDSTKDFDTGSSTSINDDKDDQDENKKVETPKDKHIKINVIKIMVVLAAFFK